MHGTKMKRSGRHYPGDWIAGGLYAYSTLISTYYVIQFSQSPYGHRPVLVYIEWIHWLIVLFTIPLLMSLRAGAIIVLFLQMASIFFSLESRVPLAEALVIPAALTCYCVARLRNSIGPPMIAIRIPRDRQGPDLDHHVRPLY